MQEILITGGAGYLGSVMTARLLAAGHRVTVLDSLLYDNASLLHLCAEPRFSFVRGDARDEQLVRSLAASADVVIPLAAIVGAPACDRDPWTARAVNLDAVRTLAGTLSRRQLLIFPTTNSGYGATSGEVYCTEETPLAPVSLYGRTKVDAERVVLQRERTISLRLATVFGASPRLRLDLLVNHFVHAAVTEGCLVIFEKDFKRNYVHVRDVADCVCHCIENADAMVGRPFNLGLDAANLSKAELAAKVEEHVPELYVHYAEFGSDPDRRNYVVSSRRLREAGFEARRDLDGGIRELLRCFAMLGRPQGRNTASVRAGWLVPAARRSTTHARGGATAPSGSPQGSPA